MNSVIIFLSQMILLSWLIFLLGSLTAVTVTVLLFWIFFFFCLTLVFVAFPLLGNFDHVVVSVSIKFLSNSKGDASFHCVACDYSCADWDGICDHLRDVLCEDIFKLSAYAYASEF